MNRLLQYLNFAGILALSFLCAGQWSTNSRLDAELTAMRTKADQQSQTIAAQAATIKQNAVDLEDDRTRLSAAESELKQAHTELATAYAERDQLKELRGKFVAALKARDQLLAQQADSIHDLAAARDDAITKFNQLAVKYNAKNQ